MSLWGQFLFKPPLPALCFCYSLLPPPTHHPSTVAEQSYLPRHTGTWFLLWCSLLILSLVCTCSCPWMCLVSFCSLFTCLGNRISAPAPWPGLLTALFLLCLYLCCRTLPSSGCPHPSSAYFRSIWINLLRSHKLSFVSAFLTRCLAPVRCFINIWVKKKWAKKIILRICVRYRSVWVW